MTPLDGEGRGARMRRVIGAWSDCDLAGGQLRLERLSTRLTKIAAYRQTLCRVEAQAHLLRRINAEIDPIVVGAEAARSDMIQSARALIEQLDWRDFEVMVDLISLVAAGAEHLPWAVPIRPTPTSSWSRR